MIRALVQRLIKPGGRSPGARRKNTLFVAASTQTPGTCLTRFRIRHSPLSTPPPREKSGLEPGLRDDSLVGCHSLIFRLLLNLRSAFVQAFLNVVQRALPGR
jgi:hypothetical protein